MRQPVELVYHYMAQTRPQMFHEAHRSANNPRVNVILRQLSATVPGGVQESVLRGTKDQIIALRDMLNEVLEDWNPPLSGRDLGDENPTPWGV